MANARTASDSSPRPLMTRRPRSEATSATCVKSAVLPTPASPVMTTAAPPPSADSTSPSSRRRSRARPTSRPSSRCAKPTPGTALVIIELMPDTPPGQGWACCEGLRDRARETLRVASTCWSKRSPSPNHECPGSPALPADLKSPVVNRPHGSTPIRSSRHNAKPAPVQARCSPREDGVEKVEGRFEPPASDTPGGELGAVNGRSGFAEREPSTAAVFPGGIYPKRRGISR